RPRASPPCPSTSPARPQHVRSTCPHEGGHAIAKATFKRDVPEAKGTSSGNGEGRVRVRLPPCPTARSSKWSQASFTTWLMGPSHCPRGGCGRLATAAFLFLPPPPEARVLTVGWPLQSGSSLGAIGAVA